MPIPVYVPGQVLAAADCNNYFTPEVAYAVSDQSVTSSTVLVNATQFAIPVAAGASYWLDGYIFFTAGTPLSSDFKWGWTFPAGLIMRYAPQIENGAGNQQQQITYIQTDTIIAATTVSFGAATFHGTVRNPTNAGTLQFQFAQGTSSATPTVLKTDSCIMLIRVS